MASRNTKSAETSYRGLGYNQLHISQLLEDLSEGKMLEDISYHGGGISAGVRYIAIGRSSELFYNVPHWVIDLRHASKLFHIRESTRLGENTIKTFNRAVHALLHRGLLLSLSNEMIKQGHYDCNIRQNSRSGVRLRFLRLICG